MKIQSFFLLLPCVASFFWLLAYLLFASKEVVYRRMIRFLAVLSFLLLFTVLSQNESFRLLMHFTLFKQVCALLLIPYFLSYVNTLNGDKPTGVFFKILTIVPVLQLVVGIESVYSVGYQNALRILVDSFTFQGPMFPYLPDNGQKAFYAGYTYLFRAFLLADFLLFSVHFMTCAMSGSCNLKVISGFFFKKSKAPVKPVQFLLGLLLLLILVPAYILGKKCYIDSYFLAIAGSFLIAVLISLIAFVGTVGNNERQSIPGILKTVRFGSFSDSVNDLSSENKASGTDAVSDEHESKLQQKVQEVESGRVFNTTDDEGLTLLRIEIASKLTDTVEGEEMFLEHDLTLSAVADRLGVLKDDLSNYLEFRYGMSFQNYINMLRINYSEKYLLTHDDATQKEIAQACGFSGASSFNSAFSKQKGVTPKIWKDRQLESIKNREA